MSSPPDKTWNESSGSELPACVVLERLGWSLSFQNADQEHEGERNTGILGQKLGSSLRKLNPWISDDNVARVIRSVGRQASAGLIDANERAHRILVHGTSLQESSDRTSGKTGRTVRFFDFANVSANDFVAAQQFRVQGTRKAAEFDIALFVNGIMLGVIECKDPGLGEKWFEEAMKSVQRYQEAEERYIGEGVPRAFETVQVIAAVAGSAGARLGTVLTPPRMYGEWKESYPLSEEALARKIGRTPTPQDRLIAGALSPEAVLDLMANFTAFETEKGRLVRKIARYQQFIAVNRAVHRIRTEADSAKRGGIIWHTQGSGKSLTMLWAAVKLRRITALENPTIVIVTDRVDLDEQIHGTFERCGFPNPIRAASAKHLAQLLAAGPGVTAMTTIQKFQDYGSGRGIAPNPAHNLFVLVDEAHRTQYKSLAANMRQALPNACFLGFTGTPIDKDDRSTPRVFGPYIHTYPIRQSVEDGATVPIKYDGRLAELWVEGKTIDAVFARVFKELSEKQRSEVRRKYATLEAVAGAPQRVKMICQDLLKHFESTIQPNGFKAQVVACSRDAAVTYFDALRELNGPEAALLISVGHNEPARLAKHRKTKPERRRLIERFKDRKDYLQILVVCDMLLTGFDAPVEQVMYLDSPLREHTLLQAIARVNRPEEGKTYGLIVDYWGVSAALQDALAIFDPKDLDLMLQPRSDELPRLEQRHRQAMRFFDRVDRNDAEACLKVLEPEDRRSEFESAFRQFVGSLDMVLPDPAGLKYRADLKWLARMRAVSRARYREGGLPIDFSDCGAKVRSIIEEHIRAEGVVQLVEPVSIFDKRFDEEVAKLKSPEAKASEMEHALRHEIHVHVDEDPVFYGRLSDQVNEIIKARREARLKDADAIGQYKAVLDQIRGRERKAKDLGLTETGLAFYNLLTAGKDGAASGQGPVVGEPVVRYESPGTDPKVLADDILKAVERLAVIDWVQKEDIQREMRREIKKFLRGAGFGDETVEPMTLRVMELARLRLAK